MIARHCARCSGTQGTRFIRGAVHPALEHRFEDAPSDLDVVVARGKLTIAATRHTEDVPKGRIAAPRSAANEELKSMSRYGWSAQGR